MKIPKLKAKKIKKFFKKLPWILGETPLLFYLILLFLSLIFSGFIFYKYNILVKKAEIQVQEIPLQFKEKTFQNLLRIWQEREKKFKEADFKIYPDPFKID